MKKVLPISIIITAYKSFKYIEECLNSIENQTYFVNNNTYEVLVGIDYCIETLNKVIEIKHKYRNLNVYLMNSNMGTYVTSNTLLNLVKYDNVIRFDSDDIMFDSMVCEIMKRASNYKIIRFSYDIIKNGIKFRLRKKKFAHGVIFCKMSVYDEFGGYKPWMCGADTDFLMRTSIKYRPLLINTPLFYRRIHQESLTSCEEFGINSNKRLGYAKLLGINKNEKIIRITNNFKEY